MKATIEYEPSKAEQNNGQQWQFILNYDIHRPADGNDIQIGAGKFIHYFSPDNLPTMEKHTIFVIDVSGSMSGRKLKQTIGNKYAFSIQLRRFRIYRCALLALLETIFVLVYSALKVHIVL